MDRTSTKIPRKALQLGLPVGSLLLCQKNGNAGKRLHSARAVHSNRSQTRYSPLRGLSTAAPPYANLVLLLELLMGVGLLAGALLARLKRFTQHAWCQSVIVQVNLLLIVLTMLPSFRAHVAPRIPLRLGKAYYALATAHAALGTLAEGGGLYILLAVGTSLLPARLRIRNYKLWMRTVLVLWWVVLVLGVATYARWYVPHMFRK